MKEKKKKKWIQRSVITEALTNGMFRVFLDPLDNEVRFEF